LGVHTHERRIYVELEFIWERDDAHIYQSYYKFQELEDRIPRKKQAVRSGGKKSRADIVSPGQMLQKPRLRSFEKRRAKMPVAFKLKQLIVSQSNLTHTLPSADPLVNSVGT
jgi:hypothetical protein